MTNIRQRVGKHYKMAKIPIRCGDEVKYLETIIKNRLRTQNRNGSVAGNLYFYPSVISKILNAYEKSAIKSAFNDWLNASLESVYFVLVSGKIVPLYLVKEVNLIPEEKSSTILEPSMKYGKDLLRRGSVTFSAKQQKVKYIVYIKYADKGPEQVYVGTEDNMVTGINDLTIDHVQPIKETLEKNILELPYMHGIDEIIRASDYTKKGEISKEIPKYIQLDEISYKGLIKELDLIRRETRGLRMIASVMN